MPSSNTMLAHGPQSSAENCEANKAATAELAWMVPGEYVVRLLDQAEGSDSGLVISREPPGTCSEFGDAKSAHLTLDGVNVEWLEKSSVLYYWSHGKYRSIATSD